LYSWPLQIAFERFLVETRHFHAVPQYDVRGVPEHRLRTFGRDGFYVFGAIVSPFSHFAAVTAGQSRGVEGGLGIGITEDLDAFSAALDAYPAGTRRRKPYSRSGL